VSECGSHLGVVLHLGGVQVKGHGEHAVLLGCGVCVHHKGPTLLDARQLHLVEGCVVQCAGEEWGEQCEVSGPCRSDIRRGEEMR
jgi:hypothetical protein